MTQKEKTSELEEIFEFKRAMTNKINYNLKQNDIIKVLGRIEKNPTVRRALKAEYKRREPLIQEQMRERSKLSARRIGLQLGVSTSYITTHYNKYVRAVEA